MHHGHRQNGSAIPVLLLVAMLAPLGASATAQTRTEVAKLRELSRRFAEQLEARRPPLYYRLLHTTTGPWGAINRDPNLRLMYLDEGGHPVFYGVDNLIAAQTIRTDQLWSGSALGISLTGSGTQANQLGIWDNGAVRGTHQEFATNRVTWADAASAVLMDHATHVAGTMVASGVVAAAQGMSYQAFLDSYDFNNDVSEMATAAANGMNVSNHSYGFVAGWSFDGTTWRWYGDQTVSSTQDYIFGFYAYPCSLWDQIAVNAPYYTIVTAAGNNRGEGPAPGTTHLHLAGSPPSWVSATDTHPVDGGTTGFDCIHPLGTAKNVITVGAVYDIPSGSPSAPAITSFSGWGPTDDGRIKPDLVANGDALYSCIATNDQTYASFTGTSMATPCVSGSLNLLVRYYESLHSSATPRSATMKALLIQTATDGGNPGPDYTYGWGLMNTAAAAQLVQADAATPGQIVEATLGNGATDVYYLQRSDPSSPLRITLAWTDPPGTPPLASLNPTTQMLVNDLDLRIEPLGLTCPPDNLCVFQRNPWILDPTNPANAATTGDNFRDNVEQVYVADYPSAYYRVTVTHKGTLASSQAYSLASSQPLFRSQRWTNVTNGPLGASASYALAWGDYDGDGDDDLYLSNSSQANKLLRNDGSGSFTDVTSAPLDLVGTGQGVAWGDYDNDGDLDLYVAMFSGNPNRLFRNDGGGSFAVETNNPPVSPPWQSSTVAASWVDYDGDGDLDIFLLNNSHPNRLFRNDGTLGFVDVTPTPFLSDYLWNAVAAWGDYDNDGDPDLYLVKSGSTNKLYRNDGGGTFTNVTSGPLGYGTTARDAAWIDYDNDGDLDLYLATTQDSNKVFRNDGGGTFTDVTGGPLANMGDSEGTASADANNDGKLDVYVANYNATPNLNKSNRLLRNLGGGAFGDVTTFELGLSDQSRGAAWADYDLDGDQDLYVVSGNNNKLLRNDLRPFGLSLALAAQASEVSQVSQASQGASDDGWLQVTLTGSATGATAAGAPSAASTTASWSGATAVSNLSTATAVANRSAIGARVRVVAGGVAQIREVSGGGGRAQGSLTLHFGLGSATLADTVEVRWPGSGQVERRTNVAPGQRLQLLEGQVAVGVEEARPLTFRLHPNAPNPFGPATTIRYELAAAAPVRLRVFDLSGRLVRELVPGGVQPAGRHAVRWDGRDQRERVVESGIYFCQLEAGHLRATRRMVRAR